MILNDGGKGDYNEVTVPMLGIWDTVLAVGSTPLPQTQLLRALLASEHLHSTCDPHFDTAMQHELCISPSICAHANVVTTSQLHPSRDAANRNMLCGVGQG